MKKSFKTEVFLTIPLILLAFCITCASLIKNQWVTGTAKISNNVTNGEYEYNFGLFSGEKVRYFGSRTAFHVKLVCSNGYCIYSCGKSKNDRNNDITNILGNQPCDNLADSYFCDSISEDCSLAPKDTISEGTKFGEGSGRTKNRDFRMSGLSRKMGLKGSSTRIFFNF